MEEVEVSETSITATFSGALAARHSPDKPKVISISGTGNWKSLYPSIKKAFSTNPNFKLDHGARYPVVFGGDEPIYLKQMGVAGAAQFKANVRAILQDHDRVFVFETQKIDCLRLNPACIMDLLEPNKTATLYFRGEIDPRIWNYLENQAESIVWEKQAVCKSSLSVIATNVSESILAEEFQRVAERLTEDEANVLRRLKDDLFETLAPEIEDHFLEETTAGAPKLRELAYRRIAVALLKQTTPAYSPKSGIDPIEFFRDELANKFVLHGLPASYVSEVSPNLSYVVKSTRRFAELRTVGPPAPS